MHAVTIFLMCLACHKNRNVSIFNYKQQDQSMAVTPPSLKIAKLPREAGRTDIK
jgi:hypothetical protein